MCPLVPASTATRATLRAQVFGRLIQSDLGRVVSAHIGFRARAHRVPEAQGELARVGEAIRARLHRRDPKLVTLAMMARHLRPFRLANVANLLLARANRRGRESRACRARRRPSALLRQLLTETCCSRSSRARSYRIAYGLLDIISQHPDGDMPYYSSRVTAALLYTSGSRSPASSSTRPRAPLCAATCVRAQDGVRGSGRAARGSARTALARRGRPSMCCSWGRPCSCRAFSTSGRDRGSNRQLLTPVTSFPRTYDSAA